MAATRTARVTLTFLMALTVVVSIAAAPVAATGHDPTHVGDDDDPIEVDGDNDSVSVSSGDDSVSVGTDGVETDTDDTTDGVTDSVTSGSTDDVTDGLATTQDEEDEELPFNYSDVNATLSLVPVNLCRQADAPEVPDPPAEPPVENPAPVDPTNPPSAPLTQCDVFNPYDPPFDPTDLPDDPDATYNVYRQDVGPNGVTIVVGGSASPDSDYPEANTIAGVEASQDGVHVVQYTYGDDGDRNYVVFTDAQHAPGTKTGSVDVRTLTIGKNAGADITCDGEVCAFEQGVAPVGSQEIPTNNSDGGGGGSPSAPVEVPCQAPVGPGDLPEPPVDPTNPPEPIPPVENPAPVDPTNPPSAPLGPCDAYDPNDPPSTTPNEHTEYTVYQANENGVVVGGIATYNRSSGPGGRTIVAAMRNDDGELQFVQYTQFEDGQKPGMLFSDVRYTPGTRQGRVVADTRVIGKRAGANITCDGEVCSFDQSVAPVGGQEIPTNNSDGGGDGGGAPSAPVEVPCQAPVGPGDLPEPPVDPTNPPEPIPPVENPTPVDPTNPPSAPLGPCDAYDPNDPPSPRPNPGLDYVIYEASGERVVVGSTYAYNETGGPKGSTIAALMQGDNETRVVQYTRGDDGQKPFTSFVSAGVDRDSLTKIGFTGYQIEGDTVVVVRGANKKADAALVCDGEVCTLSQGVAPVGDQEFRTATEDADQQQSAGESVSGDASSSAESTRDTTTSAVDSAGSTGSTVAAAAPVDSTTAVSPTVPSVFETGVPDAASAAETLLDMV